jgi:hypothetical protein
MGYESFKELSHKLCKALFACVISVRPRVSARHSQDGFPWHSVLGTFTNICPETRTMIKIGQKISETLHEDLSTFVLLTAIRNIL